MDFYQTVIVVFLGIFAIWKVHDLIFPDKLSKRQRLESRLNKNLIQFYAEFTHKTMNNQTEYTKAPKEIYQWITLNYHEWLKNRNNTK